MQRLTREDEKHGSHVKGKLDGRDGSAGCAHHAEPDLGWKQAREKHLSLGKLLEEQQKLLHELSQT